MIYSIAQARELILTGPKGRTTVVNTFNRQGTANGSTVQRTVTLPNGQVYNQSVDVGRTENGGYDRNVIWTGPQGKQTTVQGVGTIQNGALCGTRTLSQWSISYLFLSISALKIDAHIVSIETHPSSTGADIKPALSHSISGNER